MKFRYCTAIIMLACAMYWCSSHTGTKMTIFLIIELFAPRSSRVQKYLNGCISNLEAAVQAFTLADPEVRELLLPALDPADSGIDSDATDSERRDRRQARQNEESIDEESDVTVEIDMPVPYCAQHPNRSYAERPVRVSPSLFEVELTASDEDDASVLELIIPYQQPRYRKLPTSSPLKTKIRAPRYLCGFLCCFRK